MESTNMPHEHQIIKSIRFNRGSLGGTPRNSLKKIVGSTKDPTDRLKTVSTNF